MPNSRTKRQKLNTMWKESDNKLSATFKFENFVQAFAFMTEVAFHAEQQGHHPNWSNVYNTVEIHLNTHDAGDVVTDKDHKLARAIDKVYQKFN
ncbi:4a-hydroxytetrahydrobiopterin dehydratase [Flavilitoribacter nigricans]